MQNILLLTTYKITMVLVTQKVNDILCIRLQSRYQGIRFQRFQGMNILRNCLRCRIGINEGLTLIR